MPASRARAAAVFAAVALASAVLPAGSSAASRYCSSSGDVCFGAFGVGHSSVLRLTLAARYFGSYELCVRGPARGAICRSFAIRRSGSEYGSTVRWAASFPDVGAGTYRARWRQGGRSLGPAIAFHPIRRPALRVSPSSVRAGGWVHLSGYTAGCPTGELVTLISGAFPPIHDFAGLPAVYARVFDGGDFGLHVRIPSTRRRGAYTVSARCGGGNLGLFPRLRVR